MSEKKTEIIETALAILTEQGYPALSMRNLAKHCDLKLASLQYHFKNWQSLIDAMAEYLIATYMAVWEEKTQSLEQVDIGVFIETALEDLSGIDSCALWPQLWAMGQQEPAVEQALENIYEYYLGFIEEQFFQGQCEHPREEALMLMSMLEGMILFLGENKKYSPHRSKVRELLVNKLRLQFS